MSLSKVCDTKGVRFTQESIDAIDRINNRVDLANQLTGLLAFSPVVEIFGSKKSFSNYSRDIYEYHWEEFGDAMGSINPILKNRVWEEATYAAMSTTGGEREFWECVMEVSR
ncbi:hypothetical protein [Vibrio intestinalis]|uniref:hypothetical protein n=1 Tax=Vibrio intestinalis TaxID=2933291 RepID=UPI0021A5C65C|nr:hypothetical protein [Vibrio intestinalis]